MTDNAHPSDAGRQAENGPPNPGLAAENQANQPIIEAHQEVNGL